MNAKALVLVLLLALTAGVLHVRGSSDRTPFAVPLDQLSLTIGRWQGTDIPIPQDELQILGDGRFLNRTYRDADAAPIDLLIAYFPSQRSGDAIHSPQNCLPGAGWSFQSAERIRFTDDAGVPHRTGKYVVANGTTRYLVLYWYRSQGEDIAGDYAAKAHLLLQSVRDGRTDGALVRIMTPLLPGEPEDAALQRARGFTATLDPMLEPYLPR